MYVPPAARMRASAGRRAAGGAPVGWRQRLIPPPDRPKRGPPLGSAAASVSAARRTRIRCAAAGVGAPMLPTHRSGRRGGRVAGWGRNNTTGAADRGVWRARCTAPPAGGGAPFPPHRGAAGVERGRVMSVVRPVRVDTLLPTPGRPPPPSHSVWRPPTPYVIYGWLLHEPVAQSPSGDGGRLSWPTCRDTTPPRCIGRWEISRPSPSAGEASRTTGTARSPSFFSCCARCVPMHTAATHIRQTDDG